MVQLAMLGILTSIFRLNYLPATALAVEAAVLHNFLWHERFTWTDRASVTRRQALGRLLRFNLTTGAVSILGNLLLMRLLVGQGHLPTLAANMVSIAACSLANFLASEYIVFRAPLSGCVLSAHTLGEREARPTPNKVPSWFR